MSPVLRYTRYYSGLLLCCTALLAACHAEPLAVPIQNPAVQTLIAGGLGQVGKTLYYDAAYSKLAYPGGDVPLERGVCTDVVVRAFRQAGLDLQVLVHEDMRRNFKAYPALWGLTRPDRNIDHRRVPNLATFFKRQGKALAVTQNPADYQPGDLVTWRLSNNLGHIGLVSNHQLPDSGRFLIIHNIGAGAQLEDVLFAFTLTGHYRFFP